METSSGETEHHLQIAFESLVLTNMAPLIPTPIPTLTPAPPLAHCFSNSEEVLAVIARSLKSVLRLT